MRVDRLHELEIELLHQLEIAVDLFQHRIDDERFAAPTAREHVAIRARDAVEQLPEDHRPLPRGPEIAALRASGTKTRLRRVFLGAFNRPEAQPGCLTMRI